MTHTVTTVQWKHLVYHNHGHKFTDTFSEVHGGLEVGTMANGVLSRSQFRGLGLLPYKVFFFLLLYVTITVIPAYLEKSNL